MPTPVELVAEFLWEAERAVAFTGAGISTESGIPDFRSPGGVWATSQPVYFNEFLASEDARCEYWRQKSITHHEFMQATPNVGHRTLARWESAGHLLAVVTQNIDGLHQIAGSQRVLELHGNARYVSCLDCGARDDADPWVRKFLASGQPPVCPHCGGLLKHATVSFGQMLPAAVLQECIQLSKQADLFLAMGSSLVVEPAASLPRVAKQRGCRLVIINRDPTPQDDLADIVIHDTIGPTLQAIDDLLTQREAKSH